jgi:hypothetical protein
MSAFAVAIEGKGDIAFFDATFDPKQLLQRHAFLGQFLFCFLVLGQVRQAHAT